jgi:hypothetical protein
MEGNVHNIWIFHLYIKLLIQIYMPAMVITQANTYFSLKHESEEISSVYNTNIHKITFKLKALHITSST